MFAGVFAGEVLGVGPVAHDLVVSADGCAEIGGGDGAAASAVGVIDIAAADAVGEGDIDVQGIVITDQDEIDALNEGPGRGAEGAPPPARPPTRSLAMERSTMSCSVSPTIDSS